MSSVKSFMFEKEAEESLRNTLKIVYPSVPVDLEPTSLDPSGRQVLVNVYEPLVKNDRDLKLAPALAVSWGMIDDTTWEFRLRPNVYFHDGSKFNVKDVVASLNRAKNFAGSQIGEMFSSIAKLNVSDDLNFEIKTKKPDPLLLQKLSLLLIFPSEYENEEEIHLNGTGPYMSDPSFLAKKGEIVLDKFENYWGEGGVFEKVDMRFQPDKLERLNMFLSGEVDFLAFVPYETVSDIAEKEGFEIASIPSLEVQFLLFNMNSDVLKKKEVRESFELAVNKKSLVESLGQYVRSVNQFVSNGIFGFDPEISDTESDADKAREIVQKNGVFGKTVQIHLPKGLSVLGEHLRTHLADVGLNPVISYLEPWDFTKSISGKKADVYFLAFKSDVGDALDFLSTIADSKGDFNIGGYKNEVVDNLIESATVDLNPESRQNSLQEAMKMIVEQDVIGVPLFEYESVYAYRNFIEISPRIDGLIYFDELTKK